jgi:hypothetical protein
MFSSFIMIYIVRQRILFIFFPLVISLDRFPNYCIWGRIVLLFFFLKIIREIQTKCILSPEFDDSTKKGFYAWNFPFFQDYRRRVDVSLLVFFIHPRDKIRFDRQRKKKWIRRQYPVQCVIIETEGRRE